MVTTMPENDHYPTMQRILDSAERLFAEKGYSRTSLRAITSDAGVNLAAVNYHFGSKEELVRQVFQRKMAPLNRIRSDNIEQVLEQARGMGRRPAVKDLLRAFIDPTFELALETPEGRSFIKLIIRSIADTDGTLSRNFIESAIPVLTVLHEAMCRALPTHEPRDVLFRLVTGMSTMGSMLMRLSSDTTLPLFDEQGIKDFRQWATNKGKLIDFIAAGMEAE